MKRLVILLSAIFMMTAPTLADVSGQPPAPNFGSPPPGEVPILFNDQHVYANPSTIRNGRVLAGLVKGGALMVPLRSMFEQMGATVSYDAASHTATASKSGAQVQVTLGKAAVVINGESRPLDVPPIMYKGALLVPIRVISEGLGAYVQWVPEQHLTVVRYVSPTPVPTPVATPAPATPPPTPAPTATPVAWQISVTPYVWLPTINGTINYDTNQLPGGGTGELSLSASPNNYLNHLNSGALFAIDAHTSSFDTFSDFMWMNFSNTKTTSATVTGPFGRRQLPVTFAAGGRLVTNIWTVGAGVPVVHSSEFNTILFAGERFTQLKSAVNWDLTNPSPFLNRSGSASFTDTMYQFIGGLKGDVYLSPDKTWYVPYYVDIGSGTNASTWQYLGGIGYGRGGSLIIAYRGLAYTTQRHVPNIRFNGPLIGYTFRF